jgi:hypothetical protein
VGADWPDEADEPSGERSNRQDGQSGSGRPVPAETRSREECYADQHEAVSAQQSATARQNAAEEQAAAEKWDQSAEESRWMWGEYQRKWPPEERPPVDKSADPPGSWRGDRDRYLDRTANDRVEAACDRIAIREDEKISPAMRDVESQDPDRHLVGFDRRLKGRDRIKEKACLTIKQTNRSPEDAVSLMQDAVRYTFQYNEYSYTKSVRADIGRLKDRGFELHKLKNSWSDEQYKGINSQWIEPDTGQRLEVQFHTRISFEAKQLTHSAYERLRSKQADKFEELVLEAFQEKVTGEVPIPPSADTILDYPERRSNAR